MLDALHTGSTVDGLNDQGLSFEYLYLPGETTYQTIPTGHEKQAISYLQLGDWVLGNFKSVAEVRAALPSLYVFATPLPATKNMIFPLHAAIHDANGNSLVVEFIQGKIKIYENKLGVLTNSPAFDWQVANLRNYVNLNPLTPQPEIINGITFAATGQGAGMVGLPGDISPPSRFVKVNLMLKTVLTPKDAPEALNQAIHIINNVDIPAGFVREPSDRNKASNEITQWVVFKDLKNKIFYYRTYKDMTLHAVDLRKVNLTANAPKHVMPIASEAFVLNVTDEFNNKKETELASLKR
jgi:choloylglycine hydrolase